MVSGLSALVVAAVVAVLIQQQGLRSALAEWTGVAAPGGIWRLATILLVLTNLKVMPLGWHVGSPRRGRAASLTEQFRFFRGLIYQVYFQPTPIPPHALFQPVITSSRTVLLEIDYNLHKSNSTYFANLDISRTHLYFALFRNGIRKDSPRFFGGRGDAVEKRLDSSTWYGIGTGHAVILGAVSCSFRREIAPYQRYEMWTRILAWDRKWLYMVTHIVQPGVARPAAYTLQPWKRGSVTPAQGSDMDKTQREKLKAAVLATCLSKYVIKKNRRTVSPEVALMRCDMLPPKPEGWAFQDRSSAEKMSVEDAVLPTPITEADWNWDTIEAERLRGLRLAESITILDALHDEFDGGSHGVLGIF